MRYLVDSGTLRTAAGAADDAASALASARTSVHQAGNDVPAWAADQLKGVAERFFESLRWAVDDAGEALGMLGAALRAAASEYETAEQSATAPP